MADQYEATFAYFRRLAEARARRSPRVRRNAIALLQRRIAIHVALLSELALHADATGPWLSRILEEIRQTIIVGLDERVWMAESLGLDPRAYLDDGFVNAMMRQLPPGRNVWVVTAV